MATGLIPHPRALSDGFAEAFAALVGSAAGVMASVAPTQERVAAGWLLEARLDGAAMGVLTLGLGTADAERLAALVGGTARPAGDDELASALRGICDQVVDALAHQPLTSGLTLASGEPRHSTQTPAGDLVSYRLTATEEWSPTVSVWAHVERAADAATAAASQPAAASWSESRSATPYPANLDVILDIDLPLSVRFGESEMTLDALTRLGPGSVIDLRRSPDDPVDVLVNGRLVARGEVVVVSGNYGVRILEVVSAADRMRTMRA
jgi:flagellar motor switch protein FliN/FliY